MFSQAGKAACAGKNACRRTAGVVLVYSCLHGLYCFSLCAALLVYGVRSHHSDLRTIGLRLSFAVLAICRLVEYNTTVVVASKTSGGVWSSARRSTLLVRF